MNQADIRSWHRGLGIVLAIFIILQGGSGLLITLSEWDAASPHSDERHAYETGHPMVEDETVSHQMGGDETMGHHSEMGTAHDGHSESSFHNFLGVIHHGTGPLLGTYRVLLGIGLLIQTVLGVMIFLMIKKS